MTTDKDEITASPKIWTDINRFNQDGYSAPTIFPIRENYDIFQNYEDDLRKAKLRDESRDVWQEEMADDFREQMRMDAADQLAEMCVCHNGDEECCPNEEEE